MVYNRLSGQPNPCEDPGAPTASQSSRPSERPRPNLRAHTSQWAVRAREEANPRKRSHDSIELGELLLDEFATGSSSATKANVFRVMINRSNHHSYIQFLGFHHHSKRIQKEHHNFLHPISTTFLGIEVCFHVYSLLMLFSYLLSGSLRLLHTPARFRSMLNQLCNG